jgi:serine/threonine protein kinase
LENGAVKKDFDRSLGAEQTVGAAKRRPTSEVSLGDERTLGDGRSGQDTVIDDIEVVDLEARYRVEGTLGQGGMGAVLLATDTRLDRKVAIKRILGEAAGNRMAVQRFLTEAKAIAALNHPNIVQIHDYGRAKDGPFLIMEYVDGGSLLDRCRESALPLDEAIDLACQLCDGLARAHDLGIIHRDIKPANVLLTKGGPPKLTDFGLAKAQASDHGHTVTGAVLGTPDFMPPEQRHDASLVDHRSDLWSLAATVYQMVTGRSPKVIRLHELPQALQAVMARAFEDAKDDRYQSAREFRDALKTCCRSLEASAVAASLGEGQCPRCGAQNDSKRKFCRGCAASLEAPCLKCGQIMPMWDDVCGACGTKQSTLLDVRRSAFEDDRVSAESLLANFRFSDAEEVAERHSQWVHDRFEDGSHWAREFLHRIEETRSKQLGLLSAALADATRYESGGDFPGAIACLEKIPIPLQSVVVPGHESAQGAIERLRKTDADNSRLERFIQACQRDGNVTGLMPYVEKLIKRLPQRADLRALQAMLEEHERKIIDVRDEALLRARASLEQRDYDSAIEILSQIDSAVET